MAGILRDVWTHRMKVLNILGEVRSIFRKKNRNKKIFCSNFALRMRRPNYVLPIFSNVLDVFFVYSVDGQNFWNDSGSAK